ncbi:MAG TPA: VWA domain-containing protein [Xanthobacteraceae bacterium]|nr:VWA domain-containing protein [Xanthobacteraceae bacterium]
MLIARFLQDRRGVVVPIFALLATAIFGFVGAAIDYTRAAATRVALQAALDSTALMMSKEIDPAHTEGLTAKAEKYFRTMFTRKDARLDSFNAVLGNPEQGSFTLTVTAAATIDTTVSRVIGQKEMHIGSTGIVSWGIKRLELALALDNTGSMANSGKMDQLKTAVHNMLDTLQKAAKKPDDVKVAIIPFDTKVNIGASNISQTYVNFSLNNINSATWNGCVIDRDKNFDVNDSPPVQGSSATLFPAATCSGLAEAMPLTNDWAQLNAKVDQMNPSGNTNVTIGLVWAWHALTNSQPLTQAADPQPDLDKVIILLTDGQNTQNRFSTTTSSIDRRTEAVCANLKATNIKVYTVRVIDGNATLLKDCATRPEYYYDVQQSSQLIAVFSSIAQNLANLRITK